jgi:hypothetical protein
MLRWLSNNTATKRARILGRKNSQKLPRPDKLTSEMVRYLTLILGHSPSWVQGLKYVKRPRAGIENICDVRVFDELLTTANKANIMNFNSLDDFPDMILFEGWLNKDDGIVILK